MFLDSINSDIEKLGFVAGIIEGEGHIGLHKRTRGDKYVTLIVNMIDLDVILKLKKWTGFGRIYGPYQPNKTHYAPIYRWTVAGKKELEPLLLLILPYLGNRKREAAYEVLAQLKNMKGRNRRKKDAST